MICIIFNICHFWITNHKKNYLESLRKPNLEINTNLKKENSPINQKYILSMPARMEKI